MSDLDEDKPMIALIDDKEPYAAYGKVHPDTPGKFPTLDIVTREQAVDTVMYRYILRQHYLVPSSLSLVCADAAIILTGRALNEIHDLVKHCRVAELQVYSPVFHREPPEGVPVIERVIVEPRNSS